MLSLASPRILGWGSLTALSFWMNILPLVALLPHAVCG